MIRGLLDRHIPESEKESSILLLHISGDVIPVRKLAYHILRSLSASLYRHKFAAKTRQSQLYLGPQFYGSIQNTSLYSEASEDWA